MERLSRKIDSFLTEWKKDKKRLPLIVKGARQIGKTEAIRHFARKNYRSVVEINFALQKQYRTIFDNGFEVDTILRNITLYNPDFTFLLHLWRSVSHFALPVFLHHTVPVAFMYGGNKRARRAASRATS